MKYDYPEILSIRLAQGQMSIEEYRSRILKNKETKNFRNFIKTILTLGIIWDATK